MKPSAVLLIDLENFFCSREDHCRKSPNPSYDRARFKDDLERLLAFARGMTASRDGTSELPFTVRRAYADYNVVRYIGGTAQHYLRPIPEEVLSQGVEPVQVFRLSRGGKNAADMKMATDATSLLFTATHAEHFVFVTGDADFIPVILELKRHGRAVSVIGVTGATSPKLQRFVDNFELFEDLLAAEEAEARAGTSAPAADALAQVAGALARLLARTHPLRFAAVKPLLSKELGHPFDPSAFGCDTTGDFLRNHQAELGLVIRQGQHDSEIDLANGSLNGEVSKPSKPDPHSAAHYKHLLAHPRASADREAKVYAVPWAVLVWACDTVVPLLAPPSGEPTTSVKLLPKLLAAAETADVPDALKHVRFFYPTLRAGLPTQADGLLALPNGATGAAVRSDVLRSIAHVLKSRITDGAPRADALAAVFEPGVALDQATAECAAALAAPPPEPPAPKPPPAVDDLHTAGTYVKLLKAGGARGSETETFKVLPVPWPSVERVCADVFAALATAGGSASLPRDQLVARVTEAGKELGADGYDKHVRRVLGILRLSGDAVETGDAVALAPDVVSGHDLRARALSFLLQLLQLRLEERGEFAPIRPAAFVAAIEAGPLADRLLEEVTPAVAWLYRPEGEPAGGAEPIDAPAIDFSAVPAEHSSGEFSAINMAALTSEAVAAATADELPAEPIAEAIPVPDPPMSAPDEAILTLEPVGEWLPADNPLALDLSTADGPILLPEPEPQTLIPLSEVDRMKPPPLPRRVPPPLPPLPPESA